MKLILGSLVLAVAILALRLSAEETNDDANAAWQRMLTLLRPLPAAADGSKTAEVERLTSLEKTADSFWQRFPEDSRIWDAKLVVLQTRLDRDALTGKKSDLRALASDTREIAESKAAPNGTRAEAAYLLVETRAGAIAESRDASQLGAFDADVKWLAETFPGTRQALQAELVRLELYTRVAPAKADALLKEMAASKDPRLAGEAQRRLAAKELMTKPLELKFTSVDGAEIDLAKLRGKVVLVDFWATWCGPCRVEIPNVVNTYKKHHPKGFEIIGISLDRDKDKLLAYTKEQQMTWPQYFDGRVWENEISSRFGITGIPTMWLVDKKGYIRTMEARADLDGQVAKLLAE
jgi:thiol-disulfide isomerase/thioredoxin